MRASFAIAALLATCNQALGSSLSGLWRIQQTVDGQDLVLTAQGENQPPKFEVPNGDGTQIWQFKEERADLVMIQSVSTHGYIDCETESGLCLESPRGQKLRAESRGANKYIFADYVRHGFLSRNDQDEIDLEGHGAEDLELFDVIRVVFCKYLTSTDFSYMH